MTAHTTAQVPDVDSLSRKPEAEKIESYPWFDWLRFFLASIVVLGHAGFQFLPFLNGKLAVAVFFALSGWLIGGILLRTELAELPRFFFNRATRIWIPYALAIALLYGVAAAKEGIDFFWFKYLILDVTFTHQLYTFFPAASFEMPMDGSGNQFWSIAVEEQFYLLAPLIIIFTPFGRSLKLWSVIAFIMVVLDWNFAPISLGVCAAILQRDFNFTDRKGVRFLAILVSLFCAIAMSLLESRFVLAPLFAVSTILAVAIPGGRSSIALIAGGLSYPLYLNHWIGVFVINFFSKRWWPIGDSFFVTSQYILNVIIAFVLYWMIDRVIQKRRNSWFSPRIGQTLAATAYILVFLGIVTGGAMHLFGPRGEIPQKFEQSFD